MIVKDADSGKVLGRAGRARMREAKGAEKP